MPSRRNAAGLMTRREFVARAAALGLAVSSLGAALVACGGDAEITPEQTPPDESPPP